jgi:hypothetical protein
MEGIARHLHLQPPDPPRGHQGGGARHPGFRSIPGSDPSRVPIHFGARGRGSTLLGLMLDGAASHCYPSNAGLKPGHILTWGKFMDHYIMVSRDQEVHLRSSGSPCSR